MKNITMCNYYGMCDRDYNVLGHTCKVTKEYLEVLSRKYNISLIASPCIINAVKGEPFKRQQSLKYDIYADDPFTLRRRIYDKIKLLRNIRECFRNAEDEILFFYQVDFFFFFYVAMFYRIHQKKLYCLVYHQDFTGGCLEKLLNRFYKKALRKIDGVLYTQKGHPVEHPNAHWMPDYLYTDKRYLCYRNMEKTEKAVCLGTMNRYKQIEEVVEAFSKNRYPLEIIGRFDDPDRFKRLKQCASENIVIENRVLCEKEYYEKLGSARFSILPYDMKQYQNRTSGVLLESLYVGSIPIVPTELMEQNHLTGIGYRDVAELADIDPEKISHDVIEDKRREILDEFGEERIIKVFDKMFRTQ